MSEGLRETSRTKLRRRADRGSFDRALGVRHPREALVAHVGSWSTAGRAALP